MTNTKATSYITPTIQTFLSGSGTYTKPARCICIKVKMVGGGCGGNSGQGSVARNPGVVGSDSTFSVHSGSAILTAGKGGTTGAGGAKSWKKGGHASRMRPSALHRNDAWIQTAAPREWPIRIEGTPPVRSRPSFLQPSTPPFSSGGMSSATGSIPRDSSPGKTGFHQLDRLPMP